MALTCKVISGGIHGKAQLQFWHVAGFLHFPAAAWMWLHYVASVSLTYLSTVKYYNKPCGAICMDFMVHDFALANVLTTYFSCDDSPCGVRLSRWCWDDVVDVWLMADRAAIIGPSWWERWVFSFPLSCPATHGQKPAGTKRKNERDRQLRAHRHTHTHTHTQTHTHI